MLLRDTNIAETQGPVKAKSPVIVRQDLDQNFPITMTSGKPK
jgi:hypothetical protein